MNIAVVTLFPEMFSAITDYGISARAVTRGLVRLHCVNPRSFTSDRHQTVDDRPYGGGPGMVMLAEPLHQAVVEARNWLVSLGESAESVKVIYLSPQGRKLDQGGVEYLGGATNNLILIAGRYEGIDERFIEAEVDEEWSIGDYVLSGGELPAMVLVDALIRLHPDALGDEQSAREDSFVNGLLDCPHYTRPEHYRDKKVPEVLLSGDHKRIAQWRLQQSLGRTWQRRPDLLAKADLDDKQQALLQAFQREQSQNKS